MRPSLAAILVVFTVAGGWVLFNAIKVKSVYNNLLKDPGTAAFTLKRLDGQDQVLLAEVRDHWRSRQISTNEPSSSVQGIVQLLHSPLPQFYFSSASKIRRAMMFAMTRQTYSDFSTNRTIYLSEDGHVAVLRGTLATTESPCVYLFQDDPGGGVRETLYYKPR